VDTLAVAGRRNAGPRRDWRHRQFGLAGRTKQVEERAPRWIICPCTAGSMAFAQDLVRTTFIFQFPLSDSCFVFFEQGLELLHHMIILSCGTAQERKAFSRFDLGFFRKSRYCTTCNTTALVLSFGLAHMNGALLTHGKYDALAVNHAVPKVVTSCLMR